MGRGHHMCAVDPSESLRGLPSFLAAWGEFFEANHQGMNKAVGFGAIKKNKFVHCGREYEKIMREQTKHRYMSV